MKRAALAGACWLAATLLATQPGKDTIHWLATLQWLRQELHQAGGEARRRQELAAEIRSLVREIRAAGLDVPAESAPGSDTEVLIQYLDRLRAALEEYERSRPGGAFQLGRVEIHVAARVPQAGVAATVDENAFRMRNAQTVATALASAPGVHLDRIGQRNELAVLIRGFDVRQIPLYVDGIPVYVPYDGYMDLDRMLVAGVSEIEVAKGFTSPLYGPNALGGAVNLISREPAKPFHAEAGAGYGSGDQVQVFFNGGVRRRQFWTESGFSWLSADGFPLSAKFGGSPTQPPGRRLNAWREDSLLRLRFAWTPGVGEQYSFTFARQQGEKGQPPYAGLDPAVRVRYWQWPQWDKQSYYLIGSRELGPRAYARARIYRDEFHNVVRAFDDARYATQLRPSSFTSLYNDATHGAVVEFGASLPARQALKTAFFVKQDRHQEGNLGEPRRNFRDLALSLGLEDTIRLDNRTTAVLGFSADWLASRRADDVRQGQIVPFPTGSTGIVNAQAGLWRSVTESGRWRLTFARKSRLPTMKDRYSYRLGLSVPNPWLRPERASNWETGYSQLVGRTTLLEMALFGSWLTDTVDRFYLEPNVFQLRNLGRTRHLGAELAARSSPHARLDLTVNYTYVSRRNLSDPGIPPVGTPRHRLYGAVTGRIHARLLLYADAAYESDRLIRNDAGRLMRTRPFWLSGLGATVHLSSRLELQAGGGNLFDRNYWLMDGYPEAGRHGYFNLRYRF
ncbi:MAG: TonB-dependent receptor [Bryobacterales bacterium]|nr:TonB-dependent receptor [Bryobacteraceae bacterium]MDW8129154.1 TonB-dependent receptor [Bryobacterales bacterium]